MRNFLQLSDLENDEIKNLINEALAYKNKKISLPCFNKSVALIFLEASTRTKVSFELAALRSGNHVINLDAITSSLTKGETMQDTLDTLGNLEVSIAIIRSSDELYYQDIDTSKIKIINAGDGTNGHPSQSLLDLVTIYEHFNTFDKKVLIMGDIKHSRVARSNINIMARLGLSVDVYAPEIFKTDEEFNYITDLDNNLENYDVIMLLRNQLERHEDSYNIQDVYLEKYGLSKSRLEKLSSDAIIMHPGPFNRNVELDEVVLKDKRNKIDQQVTNGLYARIAILNYVLGE